MAIGAIGVSVLVMWKKHTELGNKVSPFCRRKEGFTKTRKRMSRRIEWGCFHMAVRANLRDGPLAREELLPMTTQARLMLRIFRYIGKRCIAFAHVLPIRCGKLMTRLTCQLLFGDVSSMRKV